MLWGSTEKGLGADEGNDGEPKKEENSKGEKELSSRQEGAVTEMKADQGAVTDVKKSVQRAEKRGEDGMTADGKELDGRGKEGVRGYDGEAGGVDSSCASALKAAQQEAGA